MRQILLLVIMICPSCDNVTWVDGEDDYEYSEAGREIRLPDLGEKDPDSNLDFSTVPIIDATPPPIDVMPLPDAPLVCRPYGRKESCEMQDLLGSCSEGAKFCRITEWTRCYQVNNPRHEICDAIDNDCDGRNNEAPRNLGPDHADPQNDLLSRRCYTGTIGTDKNGPCRSGVSLCESSEEPGPDGPIVNYLYGECQNQVLPHPEVCDSLDNDCDGQVDEELLNACDECGHAPEEVCNALDDDCDGSIDETLLNDCGDCGPTPRELCDFIDNDCDGTIDEEFLEGDCNCDHPDYVPQPEVCNGIDEDCDFAIDEGPFGGPLTMLCSTDPLTGNLDTHARREDGPQYIGGECRLGVAFCELGPNERGEMQRGYYECLQEIIPSVERCDDLDNDCDGAVDENFQQGSVAVMMVVDVSGSMEQEELRVVFDATRDSVRRVFNLGAINVCYMLSVVGNDDMPDPYLYSPGDNCVPGVEDPPVFPVEDMEAAISGLRGALNVGSINQGGGTENTLDAIGKFFTDDLIDWDQDGMPENILWSTNRPSAILRGLEDVWEVDLSQYTHRIVVVMGDEPAQGHEWSSHDAARAMIHAGGMVFIIGTAANRHSYQPLVDFGAVHTTGLDGIRNQNAAEIAAVVEEAIEEAACINNRQLEPPPEEEEEEEMACYENNAYDKVITTLTDTYKLVSYSCEHYGICF
jgi:hypothetical protein